MYTNNTTYLDNCKNLILLSGDSWGVGEFDDERGKSRVGGGNISHRGLHHYLEEYNHSILNLSRAGGSNIESFQRCADFIENNTHLKNQIKSIIVFQTEWIRDILDAWHILECVEYSLEELKSRWVSRFYTRFSELSQKYNIPVYVIGGCSDTLWLDKMHIEYPGVQVVCQSVTNLLVNNNHRIDRPVLMSSMCNLLDSLILLKGNTVSALDKNFLVNESITADNRVKIWQLQRHWFYPDGKHPNREGHKKLFEHLCTQIPWLIN